MYYIRELVWLTMTWTILAENCELFQVKTTPENTTIMVLNGGSVDLTCKPVGHDPNFFIRIRWRREKVEGILSEQDNLPLKNVGFDETDTYRCILNYLGENKKKKCIAYFNITVEDKPVGEPNINPDRAVIRVLEHLNLTCNTSGVHRGVPEATEYLWLKNGKEDVDQTVEVYTYTPKVVRSNVQFQCAVKNVHGLSSLASANVTVEAPLLIEELNFNQTYQPRYDDKDFSVTYIISGSHLNNFSLTYSNINVQKRSFTVNSEIKTGEFSYGQKEAQFVSYHWIIDGIDQTSCSEVTLFNGIYKFIVDGTAAGIPSSEESTFSINVQYPAIWNGTNQNESSPQCKPKTLHCDVCAEPAPTYSWYFMGKELKNASDAELIFNNVSKDNFGQYSCTFRNTIGMQSFNISLEEDGSPDSPLNFALVSKTSKTLLATWDIVVKECYELEFELQIWNGTDMLDKVIYQDCRVEKHCEFRITNLQPKTRYCLELRAKTGKDKTMFYSDFVNVQASTAEMPVVEDVQMKVTEPVIVVRWKYATETETVPMDVTTEDVTVVIYYKESGDDKYFRHPENGRIPAEAEIAHIDGNFDTSATYLIKYEVYEGDQLTMDGETAEFTQSESPANVVIIILSVIGAVIGIGVLGLLVGILCLKQRRGKRNTGSHSGASSQSNAGYEGIIPTDVSCDDVSTELSSLPPNYEKLTRSGPTGAQYMDLIKKSGDDYEHAYEYVKDTRY